MPSPPTPFPSIPNLFRSPLFLVSATALLVLLLTGGLFQKQQYTLIDTRTEHYGQALSSLGARQATDATLNHDLVSLQVILGDIARNPDVLNATIHDVENRLLVQAGDSPNTGDYTSRDSRSFTAPITLHDSVAGYVSVTLDTQNLYEQQNDSWLMGLLGLAATLLALSLLNHRKPSIEAATQPNPLSPTHDPHRAAPETLPSRGSSADPTIDITLDLHCLNSDTLKGQLSTALQQQLFDELEHKLSGINTLYNGRVIEASSDGLRLSFRDDDLTNASFRAVCAAELLFQWLRNNHAGVQLQYAAAIYQLSSSLQLSQQMARANFHRQCQNLLSQQPATTLLLHDDSSCNAQLLQRLQIQPNDNNQSPWHTVASLQPSYQTLLDKQARQLQNMLVS